MLENPNRKIILKMQYLNIIPEIVQTESTKEELQAKDVGQTTMLNYVFVRSTKLHQRLPKSLRARISETKRKSKQQEQSFMYLFREQ